MSLLFVITIQNKKRCGALKEEIFMNPKFLNRFIRTFEVERELYRYMYLTSPLSLAALIILATVLVIDIVASIILGMSNY